MSHPRSLRIISPLLPLWLNSISLTTKTFFTLQWPDILEAFPSIPGSNLHPGAFLMSKLYMPFRYHVTNSLTHPSSEPSSYHLFMPFCACSNIAPHSRSQFDPRRHFLRQDLIFGPPGAHLVIKWTKTLQDN